MSAAVEIEHVWVEVEGLWYNFDHRYHEKKSTIVVVRGPTSRRGQWLSWKTHTVTKYVIEKDGTRRPIEDDFLLEGENPDDWDDPEDWWDYV